jgi:hypothetical protein
MMVNFASDPENGVALLFNQFTLETDTEKVISLALPVKTEMT